MRGEERSPGGRGQSLVFSVLRIARCPQLPSQVTFCTWLIILTLLMSNRLLYQNHPLQGATLIFATRQTPSWDSWRNSLAATSGQPARGLASQMTGRHSLSSHLLLGRLVTGSSSNLILQPVPRDLSSAHTTLIPVPYILFLYGSMSLSVPFRLHVMAFSIWEIPPGPL